ncbi:MAG TPA: SGNH/GDSL hydrolase family protein [Rectinemataceae bacterium]|nr:SGNH/GDSL hydrolase family protein [Rectinemataceae bacterium]
MRKTLLCFGDSNTWGFDCERWVKDSPAFRFAPEVRWPGVLAAELGPDYAVIEEGHNGRTTVFDDEVEGEHRNALRYLQACLESHAPLDAVVIMLGTNDLKERFAATASDIAAGAARLAQLVLASRVGPSAKAPAVLLVAPFPVGREIRSSPFGEMFGYEAAIAKSRLFAERYAERAKALGLGFLDAGAVVTAHPKDSIHLGAAEHRKLGLAVAAALRPMLQGARV